MCFTLEMKLTHKSSKTFLHLEIKDKWNHIGNKSILKNIISFWCVQSKVSLTLVLEFKEQRYYWETFSTFFISNWVTFNNQKTLTFSEGEKAEIHSCESRYICLWMSGSFQKSKFQIEKHTSLQWCSNIFWLPIKQLLFHSNGHFVYSLNPFASFANRKSLM